MRLSAQRRKWNTLGLQKLSNMTRAATKPIVSPARSEPKRDRRSRMRISTAKSGLSREALRARRKFLRMFPGGFQDQDYIDLERAYKWNAHLAWQSALDNETLRKLLANGEFQQIDAMAVRIEARTHLLVAFEKMALRDAVKSPAAAEAFAVALYDLLHGSRPLEVRFSEWLKAIAQLPRRQTRVLTWPLATVFGFIAQPDTHFFLKPMVTRSAARNYGYDLDYRSRPDWSTYSGVLRFARVV